MYSLLTKRQRSEEVYCLAIARTRNRNNSLLSLGRVAVSVNEVRKIRFFLSAILMITLCQAPGALAWDPQPTNPFPGVPFEGEIPGYTVEVPCRADGDCGIGIVPVVNCPAWSAADGRNGYANDGPPGDPHKKIGLARRFCRNSWTPPTTAADDENFRNQQSLAIAAATLESQAYNAAHPGEQKCVTWGPIVHANGISTASGGVCANPVGTTPSGTTVQVSPSQVGTTTSESSGGTSNSGTSTSTIGTNSTNATSTTPKTVVPDYSQYGVGKPFTKKLEGSKSSSECPSGYQAASNYISGVGSSGLTECWPENAWAAYSVGGATWAAFKQSNGSLDVQTEQTRIIQVNAIRVLALQSAQKMANETPGLKRCNSWSGYGESGQECAYVPVQSNSGATIPQPSSTASSLGETTTVSSQPVIGNKISGTRKYSEPGASRSQWEGSRDYLAISCPLGSAKVIGIDLNGTISSTDDRWFTSCAPINLTSSSSSETSTATTSSSETSTKISSSGATQSSKTNESPTLESTAIKVTGTVTELKALASSVVENTTEKRRLQGFLNKVDGIGGATSLKTIKLPGSAFFEESLESKTPDFCSVSGVSVSSLKKGVCVVAYTITDSDGNKFTTLKEIFFRK